MTPCKLLWYELSTEFKPTALQKELIEGNIREGDPKIRGIIKKNYLKYLCKFETLVLFVEDFRHLDKKYPNIGGGTKYSRNC